MNKQNHKFYLPILKNSGQALVESILLMSILLAVISMVIKFFKDEALIQKMIATPWVQMDNVIQYGNIDGKIHPNSIERHASFKPQKL